MDGTYAPQSPDLSSFLTPSTKKQQSYQPTSQSTSAYAPRSPNLTSFNTNSNLDFEEVAQYESASLPQFLDTFGQTQQPYQAAPIPQQTFYDGYGSTNEFDEYPYPIPALPQTHSSFGKSTNTYPEAATPHMFAAPPAGLKQEYSFDGPSDNMSARAARAPAPSSSIQHKNPNPNNIEIKTKFPVARIKRIMQADEEVGKVAQVTPVAVSKALELFMIALVSGAAEKAREKGGKRVTAQHLKMVVEGDEQFDFLGEIVGRVADVQEGAGGAKRKGGAKEESESEEERKGKKGKGRRKKIDD